MMMMTLCLGAFMGVLSFTALITVYSKLSTCILGCMIEYPCPGELVLDHHVILPSEI